MSTAILATLNVCLRAAHPRLDLAGAAGGTAFLCISLTPSLLPRDWITQGLICAASAAVGYALGALAGSLLRRLHHERRYHILHVWLQRAGLATALVFVPVFLVWASWWQDRIHGIMGIAEPPQWWPLGIVGLAAAVFALLLAAGRLIAALTRRLIARLERWVPGFIAALAGTALVALLIVELINGVVLRLTFDVSDRVYQAVNEVLPEEIAAPDSPLRSGGPGSLMSWEDLGRQGRLFVAGASPAGAPQAPSGAPAVEPIRVYAGLGSALEPDERAELAVKELERTGAFDRSALVIMATTGTGWVNPVAADTIEHIYGGDTALVAMQYSYLPSYLAFVFERERAAEGGRELVDAVHRRWRQIPESQRPELYMYGESLGAYAGESAFRDFDELTAKLDGALWVGPPAFAPLRRALTERRDPGSPSRLPVVNGGRSVRFTAHAADLAAPGGDWPKPRVVYLQHASDPILWWSPRLAWQRPDWLAEPRGDDVLASVRWYPFVTLWQVSADVVHAREVPPGYGHYYGLAIVDAWAAVAAPDDWDGDNTDALREIIARRHAL